MSRFILGLVTILAISSPGYAFYDEAIAKIETADAGITETILALSQEFYGDVDIEETLTKLRRIINDLKLTSITQKDPQAIIETINQYLFSEQDFEFDRSDLKGQNPNNFYLNGVIDRKKGTCTGLSILYLAIAEELDLPIYGVKIPGHFFVRYNEGHFVRNIETTEGGKHYSDPFIKDHYNVSRKSISNGAYLRSLTKHQLTSFLLTNHAINLIGRSGNIAVRHLEKQHGKASKGILPQPGRSQNRPLNSKEIEAGTTQALKYLDKSIRLDPYNVKALYTKSMILAGDEKVDEALVYSDRALTLEPRNASALSIRSLIYALKNNYAGAIRDGVRAVLLEPSSVYFHINLAALYATEGQHHKARLTFEKAKRLQKD